MQNIAQLSLQIFAFHVVRFEVFTSMGCDTPVSLR